LREKGGYSGRESDDKLRTPPVSQAAGKEERKRRMIPVSISELCEDETEKKRHYFAIEILSKELKIPEKILAESYEKKLSEIQKSAKVKDFIVLVVMHDVRETLKESAKF
jgi:hypothetical protein